MWVIDGSLRGDAAEDIQIDENNSNSSVARWAHELASIETQRLSSLGLRALPLKVQTCGLLSMIHTCKMPKDTQRIAFNRVNLKTTFDFGQVVSVEIGSFDEDTFSSSDGMIYFCTICLLRVGASKSRPPCVDGKEMVLIFPYVFKDPRNPLTHWALVNCKEKAHYIVRRNLRQGSAIVPGQKLVSQPPADLQTGKPFNAGHDGDVENEVLREEIGNCVRTVKRASIEKLRNEWDKCSITQRAELLSFSDSKIFERALADVSSLFGVKICTASGVAEELRSFLVLSALEFEQKCNGRKVMSISQTLFEDSVAFFALLQQVCPKLWSGALRPRRDACLWSSLLEPPAEDLAELQQRVVQLIEQKLWTLADVSTSEHHVSQPGRRRRRRKKPSGACKEDVDEHTPGKTATAERQAASQLEAESGDDGAHFLGEGVDETLRAKNSITDFATDCSDCVVDDGTGCDGVATIKTKDQPGVFQHSLLDTNPHNSLPHFVTTEFANMADPVMEVIVESNPRRCKQPPVLEIDDASSIVQRLILRKRQLEQQLEGSRVKVPISELLSDSFVGA